MATADSAAGVLLADYALARRIEAAVDADIVERGTAKRPTSVVGDDIAARLR